MGSVTFWVANDKIAKDSYWDMELLKDILRDKLFDDLPKNGGIVVVPGAYQSEYVKELNEFISKYEWVIIFITSDEESKFPVEQLSHENSVIYVQYPKKGRHDAHKKWPLGYTSGTREQLVLAKNQYRLFFSGQNTHSRRKDCIDILRANEEPGDIINQTDGFSKGYEPQSYMAFMAQSMIAPAPAGPISADSFRVYEALEAGSVPIADNISNAGDNDYWRYLFDDVPFPTIDDWAYMPGHIKEISEKYPIVNNRVQAWWIQKKNELKEQIIADIERLSQKTVERSPITVIIPVSPIPSHPSIEILEQTVKSIRHHLPDAPMIITFDGVREENEHMRKNYEEFIRRALYCCNTSWNAIPLIFDEHTHQVGMARKALELVKTNMILYCEQDTPLVTDESIDWENIEKIVLNGDINICRFHFESRIPDEHKYLMFDSKPIDIDGVPIIRTGQYSQRPLLMTSTFLRHINEFFFSSEAKTFYEDRMYSLVSQDFLNNGLQGWNNWKVGIYAPEGNYKRSLHIDGRAGSQKFDKDLVF